MIEIDKLRCECCGSTNAVRQIELTMTSDNPVEIICTFCRGLIDAGIIRPEMLEGERRFRQWRQEWTPGELLPKVEQVVEVND